MRYELRKIYRVCVVGGYLLLCASLAACASWNLGGSSEPSVPQSSLSPEESSERIEEILEPKEEEASEGRVAKDDEFDSTELCLKEVMRGLLQCHSAYLDTVDSGDLERMPDCGAFFQRGIEFVAADVDAATPGLGAAMVERRSGASEAAAGKLEISRPLACMASAVLWRSLFRPTDLDAARGIPVALKIVAATSPEKANALFGLPLWSRAAYFSQVPSEFGGNLEQAAQDLDSSLEMAGPLLPYIHALKARYLCTARQDPQCLEKSEAAFRSTPANPDVYRAANRLVQWVHARYNLLFPTGPMMKVPEPSASPEDSNG